MGSVGYIFRMLLIVSGFLLPIEQPEYELSYCWLMLFFVLCENNTRVNSDFFAL